MKKDTEETKVIFKIARYPDGERDIVAFFPEASANSGRILCYSHYGQHGEASDKFYTTRCKNATPKQYAPLKKEMEVLCGYKLKIVKKITRKDREKAWKRIG